MVTSIEPGFYKNYEYGIRIENLTAVKKAKFDGFLEFETLTMVPIETRLIDPNMLENEELTWLNQYHEQVYQTLSPHLNKKEREWLMAKTNPL
jgi:Xaa-Pro aminopeptidase